MFAIIFYTQSIRLAIFPQETCNVFVRHRNTPVAHMAGSLADIIHEDWSLFYLNCWYTSLPICLGIKSQLTQLCPKKPFYFLTRPFFWFTFFLRHNDAPRHIATAMNLLEVCETCDVTGRNYWKNIPRHLSVLMVIY